MKKGKRLVVGVIFLLLVMQTLTIQLLSKGIVIGTEQSTVQQIETTTTGYAGSDTTNLSANYSLKADLAAATTEFESDKELPLNNNTCELKGSIEDNATALPVGDTYQIITTIDEIAPIITIEDYIKTPTNKDITVTAATDEGTLNAYSHTFTENGSFEFIATDEAGNEARVTVVITNIDKTAPQVTGVEDSEEYFTPVTICFNEGTATLNGSDFKSGTAIERSGSYTLVVIDDVGNVTTICFTTFKKGDIDNDSNITIVDQLIICSYLLGDCTLDERQKLAADVNNDGMVNTLDAYRIYKYATGVISSF